MSEDELAEALRVPDLVLTVTDHPDAHGRRPTAGDKGWVFQFPLEDGRILHLRLGHTTRQRFKAFLLQEEADDAVEGLLG